MKLKFTAAFAASIIAVLLSHPAEARHRHHYHHYRHSAHYSAPTGKIECDLRGCRGTTKEAFVQRREYTPREYASYSEESVIGGRPAGCPHAFCGCEASRYVFGRIIPDLNLAYNWIRRFPRAYPAPGMAAARNHHVMILISHVGGSDWLVHDGNSGHHLTREHVRSIAGYVIVDPHGGRLAYND